MADRCLLYYITDRTAFPGDEPARRRRLLEKIAEAARASVDYIQLREKDLPTRDLESLAREALRPIREVGRLATGNRPLTTALLINSRTDVALAVEADGVHLRSDDVSPQEVRAIWKQGHVGTAAQACPEHNRRGCPALRSTAAASAPARQDLQQAPLIGVSCHSPADVAQAAAQGATFAVFAPVFEKTDAPGTRPTGLAQLRQACQANIPVLALGGVTLANAPSCLKAGAAGIAAIRLFQENDIAKVVRILQQSVGGMHKAQT
jgi:thiamine-phosphate pyrophosphorylase